MVKQMASTDQIVHAPAPEVGKPSIPAPTHTLAIIQAPPKTEGCFCINISLFILFAITAQKDTALCKRYQAQLHFFQTCGEMTQYFRLISERESFNIGGIFFDVFEGFNNEVHVRLGVSSARHR